jgi:hypothetical protein
MQQPKMPDPFPLTWPEGWLVTPAHKRERSRYRVTFSIARAELFRELRLFKAVSFVISSNIPVKNDGMPYATFPKVTEPGVSVWWWTGKKASSLRVLACDQWDSPLGNLRAIGLAVKALRDIERSGASQILDRAVEAFDVPMLGDAKPSWFYDLELQAWPPHEGTILMSWKLLAARYHPDNKMTGSNLDFLRVTQAKDRALKWLAGEKR